MLKPDSTCTSTLGSSKAALYFGVVEILFTEADHMMLCLSTRGGLQPKLPTTGGTHSSPLQDPQSGDPFP